MQLKLPFNIVSQTRNHDPQSFSVGLCGWHRADRQMISFFPGRLPRLEPEPSSLPGLEPGLFGYPNAEKAW